MVVCLEPEVLEIEPESLLSVAADQKVPQIVGVEHCDQGEGEGKRNAKSLKILER